MATAKKKKKAPKRTPVTSAKELDDLLDSAPVQKMRTLTCSTPGCGITWTEPVIPGAIRKFCLEKCSDPKNRERDLRKLEARGEEHKAKNLRAERDAPDGIEIAIRPLRIAMALSSHLDPETALAISGIDPASPEVDAAAFIEQARARFPGLAAGEPAAVQSIMHAANNQAMISLVSRASTMGPSQAAAAIKSVAQAIDLQQGGAQRIFSKIELLLDLGDEPEVEP